MNPLRVTIADDQERARRGLRALLSTCGGIEVASEASTGRQAVLRVRTSCPEVVVLDLRMPEMDGFEAMRRIRRERPDTGIVVLTMYADLEVEALAAGADVFLTKGCGVDALLNAIRTAARRSGLPPDAPAPAKEAS
jgi:DNA-binding NarL/FixJ family response regulator